MEERSTAIAHAELLVTSRRYDDALRILARMPDDGAARYLSAVALLLKDDLSPALQEAERATALLPDAPETHSLRAEVLLEMDRTEAALQSAREAVRLAPDQAPFQYVLARAAAGNRDWTLAEAAARETLRLAPDWAEAHNIVALVALGRRRRKEAQEQLRHALELDPNNPYVLNNLAASMPRLRPRSRSVELLEEAVRLDPSNRSVVENLYVETQGHVRGGGFDRLDFFLGGPTMLMGLLMVAVLMGWVHWPQFVNIPIIVIAVGLIVAYSVGDWIRNRARLRRLRSGTRAMFFRRFFRDNWQAAIAGLVTFVVAGLLLAMIASAVAIPAFVVSGLLIAALPVWVVLWPRTRRVAPYRWFIRDK